MSEQDDTLLDEDLEGDEEYDLGNDEEEALLADDYEIERQNSYKGEEETDDILDLGVTDALDDLDGEDENIEFSRGNTDKHSDNDFYKDEEHSEVQATYYEQNENAEYANEQARQSDRNSDCHSVNVPNNVGDLREKLQKNMQKIYVGNGQGLEDDDCEEAKERRNRFQNERTMISPKMNNDIPDTLENVVTSEQSARAPFRGRGRGGGRIARGSRGGRFIPSTGNFNPRFSGGARPGDFDNQPPAGRLPLLQTRPLCLLGMPGNVPNQPLMYQQGNPQQQPFQQFHGPNGPMQSPAAQFVENRPQFNPGQFPSGPRIGPRLEYGPRAAGGPMVGGGTMQGPGYNCPPNQPPYHPMQPAFQNPGPLIQENQMRPMHQGNQGPPPLQGNPQGNSILGNPPGMLLTGGNPPLPLLPSGNLPLPMQQGYPRQQAPPPPPPSHGPPSMQQPNLPSAQMPSQQPPYENRLPFQEPQQFEGRNAYDARPGYPDQVPNSQFNNSMQPPVPQQSASNVHSVSLPPGHKILINPHFRGAVQPANDARLAWDTNQQQVQPQVSHSGQYPQQPPSSYQNQGSYSQSQQGPPQYQPNYQQNKSDDPYAYFSDVWQENRPQKSQNVSPSKQYVSDNYSRDNSYSDSNKYKVDSQWDQRNSYQEDHRGSHQNYRERDLPLRPRNDHVQRSRSPTSAYRDSYDQNHGQKQPSRSINVVHRGPIRPPQKRNPEPVDRASRDISPKRNKPTGNRNLHEIRRVDTISETAVEKKEEDEDPEMQEYRKKMEEQKRLREKLLREKENRRKMAAMEKQNEDGKIDSSAAANESVQQDTKPVSTLGVVKEGGGTVKVRPGVGKGRGRPINSQSIEATDRPLMRVVRAKPTSVQINDLTTRNDTSVGAKDDNVTTAIGDAGGDVVQTRQVVQHLGTRRVVIHKPMPNSKKVVATTIQKTVSNLQRSQQGLQQKVSNVQVVQIVPNAGGNALQKSPLAGGQKVERQTNVGPRMVAHKAIGGLQKTVVNVLDGTSGGHLQRNAPNSQRIVLQKTNAAPGQPTKKLPEIRSNTVRLENLAASTSEAQIRRMCQGIGTIESIRMGEGNATIVFKTQSAAMVFHKKYQRKMLDLSLITVRLVPQTAGNKVITAGVAKKS
ncbi:PREDICTED: RNA-binding protein 33-like [Dinoponera quadriceps]|uniref:RNA-binding protein 33-like n=1 Tax=Dinoponera quadriceps TaxID=609295 RepID=A0A6P3XL56_DINQU|nr:PREDICTED: RNA-binding protein 33-like [Dinoponera quadriceps]